MPMPMSGMRHARACVTLACAAASVQAASRLSRLNKLVPHDDDHHTGGASDGVVVSSEAVQKHRCPESEEAVHLDSQEKLFLGFPSLF